MTLPRENDGLSRNYLSRLDLVVEVANLDVLDPILDPKRFTWDFRRKKLRERILTESGDLSDFLTWPTVVEALYSMKTEWTVDEFSGLKEPYVEYAKDPDIGNPQFPKLLNGTHSATYIRQAYALQLASDISGISPDSLSSIFEFGGGYGALAHVARRAGFKGMHIIYDYPELSLVQRWFHGRAGIGGHGIQYLNSTAPSITYAVNLFISICALDEAPPPIRKQVLNSVWADYYMIWYTKHAMGDWGDGIDNRDWFDMYFEDRFGELPVKPICPHNNQEIVFYSNYNKWTKKPID